MPSVDESADVRLVFIRLCVSHYRETVENELGVMEFTPLQDLGDVYFFCEDNLFSINTEVEEKIAFLLSGVERVNRMKYRRDTYWIADYYSCKVDKLDYAYPLGCIAGEIKDGKVKRTYGKPYRERTRGRDENY